MLRKGGRAGGTKKYAEEQKSGFSEGMLVCCFGSAVGHCLVFLLLLLH